MTRHKFLAKYARNKLICRTRNLTHADINWYVTLLFVYTKMFCAIRMMLINNVRACVCLVFIVITKLHMACITHKQIFSTVGADWLFVNVGSFMCFQSAFLHKSHFAHITCKRSFSSVQSHVSRHATAMHFLLANSAESICISTLTSTNMKTHMT